MTFQEPTSFARTELFTPILPQALMSPHPSIGPMLRSIPTSCVRPSYRQISSTPQNPSSFSPSRGTPTPAIIQHRPTSSSSNVLSHRPAGFSNHTPITAARFVTSTPTRTQSSRPTSGAAPFPPPPPPSRVTPPRTRRWFNFGKPNKQEQLQEQIRLAQHRFREAINSYAAKEARTEDAELSCRYLF